MAERLVEGMGGDAPPPANLVHGAGKGRGVLVLADIAGGAGRDAAGYRLGPLVRRVNHDPLSELACQLAGGTDALEHGLVAGLPVPAQVEDDHVAALALDCAACVAIPLAAPPHRPMPP